MIQGTEIIQLAGCVYYFMYSWITKLNYLTCFGINKMVMLTTVISLLKLRYVLSELVLNNEITVEQKVYGIIQCGPAHPVVLVLHKDIERFDIKMA